MPHYARRRAVALSGIAAVVVLLVLAIRGCGDDAPEETAVRWTTGGGDAPALRWTVASRFDDYDRPLACGGRLGRAQPGVAHKTLPCGTPVTIVYRGREVRVPVIDRGPYVDGREFDLAGATADALRFQGVQRVQVAP